MSDGLVRYTGSWGPVAKYWHVPYSYLCLVWALAVILWNLRKSRARLDYYFLVSLFVAIVVPVVMNVILLSLWNIYPDPTSLTMVFSAGLLTYVFSKYKLFKLPQAIQVSENVEVPEVETGKSYIVHGNGYGLLKRIARAKPTVFISVKSAGWLKSYLGKEDVVTIWLSEVDAEYAILPERLEFEIEYTVIEFWRQNPGGVVVLDGVAYMHAFNSFDRLMLFLKDILDVASQYDGTVVLLDTDMLLLDDEQRHMIEEIFEEKIHLKDKVSYGVLEICDSPDEFNDVFCVSAENPSKACPNLKDAIWIRRGGEYTPEMMRMEVLYEIEKALGDGKDLVLYKPDMLFIGWKPLKLYTYIKLLVDLVEKNGCKVYVCGGVVNSTLKTIISMFL